VTIIPLVLVAILQGQAGPYADSATAALVARARERHRQQDAAVQSYQALLRTRLDAEVGRGSFARLLPFAVEEQDAQLWWQAPNDVKVVMLGRRYRTAFRGVEVNSSWTRPWFVPRFLGDSIRLLSSDGFPERAAIHPLSAGADAYYHYAIEDSMQLVLPGRTVRAIGVRVTPVRADAALIAGELWLDAATAETVRLTMVFVGKRLWTRTVGPTRADSERADRDNALVERILRVSADLEYGLYEQRYWLPYRQAVTLDIRLPWFKNLVLPVSFVTTFRDVRVNAGVPIAFEEPPVDTTPDTAPRRSHHWRRCVPAPDSTSARRGGPAGACVDGGTWPGGRYEVDVPPDSVLRHYAGWTDSLRFALTDADAAQLGALRDEAASLLERLPDSLTGRPRLGVAFERFTDIWRYNRAEGASLGWGYAWRPGLPFLSVLARARYAFTDGRLQGAVTVRREAVASRLDVEAYREMRDADVLAPGLTFTNSLSALWFARDDGAYLFAQGGLVRYQRPLGRTADLSLEARYGEESAPLRLAHSGFNDLLGGSGIFPPNARVVPGHYGVARLELAGGGRLLAWRAGVEGTAGTRRLGRGWISSDARAPLPFGFDLTASGWAGAGVGDSLPQRDFRLGGEKSLRGYAAGAFSGMSAWALGLDLALPQRGVTPVVFADAGQVAPRELRFTGTPAASVGAGLSVFGGALRLDAARPIAPHAPWRVSLVIGARR
jgi:Haemolysin secretion/activation protein ShlB/FhaC/HecB